ncbi:MAG TPA: DUF4258 domain-containing protein [Humisphaera sp.]|nr:DUF4258 domain-containing protein [Humisphaera sp.]
MVSSLEDWPAWGEWELDCSNPHLAKRMLDRSFNETDLREMFEHAAGFRPDAAPDRFVIETSRDDKPWEIIVEPDESAEILVVVTAYAVG